MRTLVIEGLGKFDVSKKGEIYHFDSLRRKHKLTPFINKRGYYDFYVRNKQERKHIPLHRLLAMAFIPSSANLPEVRHLDGNKLNNDLKNLAWGTHKDNMSDENWHHNQGENCGTSKLTWEIVWAIRELIKRKCPVSQYRLAEFFGVGQTTISDIIRGVTWQEY